MIYCEKKCAGQAGPFIAIALAMVAILVPLAAVGHDQSGRIGSLEIPELGGTMNALLSFTFAISSSIGACIAAASVSSLVLAEPESPAFADLDRPDLWTAKPFHIDPGKQHYERLPPVMSTYAVGTRSKYAALNSVEDAMLRAYPTMIVHCACRSSSPGQ